MVYLLSFNRCKLCSDIKDPQISKNCAIGSSAWGYCCLISSKTEKKCKKFHYIYLEENTDWNDKMNITWKISCEEKIELSPKECAYNKTLLSNPTFDDCSKYSLNNNTCCNSAFNRGINNISSCVFYGNKTSYFKNTQLGITLECSSKNLNFFLIIIAMNIFLLL
jgi:hypothetical protein